MNMDLNRSFLLPDKKKPPRRVAFSLYAMVIEKASLPGGNVEKKNRPGAQRLQAQPGGAGYGSRLPFLQWEERKEAASVCTGGSGCPPDSCIWMGSTPCFLLPDKKKPPRRVAFSCLEQDTGVEPAFTAWEAVVLPIYESCMCWYYSRGKGKKQPLFVEAGIRQPMPPFENHPGKNRKIPEKVLDNRHIFR